MLFPGETELVHIGESGGRIDHDLVYELGRRLDSLSRYDQYISNSKQHEAVRQFWCNMKSQEQQNILLMKQLLTDDIRDVAT